MSTAHHIAGPICPGCEGRLALAYPGLVSWFHRRKSTRPDLHVSWSFRTKVEQNQCWTDGKSRLKWPDSSHNDWVALNPSLPTYPALYPSPLANIQPQAHALDLFQITNGKGVWSPSYFRAISQESKAEGAEVIWGADFKAHHEDMDHFQWIKRAYP